MSGINILKDGKVFRADRDVVCATPHDYETLQRPWSREVKFDLSFLHMAKIWSLNSHAERKKVGCLIVKDNNIISDGYNGMPSGFDNTCEDHNGKTKWEVLHAEANAISKLAKHGKSAEGATLYITFSPCRECAKLILQAGISRVVYTDEHSCTDGLDFLQRSGIRISRYFPPNVIVLHSSKKFEPQINVDDLHSCCNCDE